MFVSSFFAVLPLYLLYVCCDIYYKVITCDVDDIFKFYNE